MIDTACGCSSSSQEIMREAKLTVITLPSERVLVDEFFRTETALLQNGYFILGNYKESSTCTPEYLNKTYKISKERIGVLPYDIAFEQAMWEGDTVAYLTGNLNCSRQSPCYPFIRELRKTAKGLYRYAEKKGGFSA